MSKYLFSLILFTFVFNSAYSQGKSDTLVYYVKNDGSVVHDKIEADFVLFILPQTQINNLKLFPVIEYYPNGRKKLITTSRTNRFPLINEGPYLSFFANGKRRTSVNNKNGKSVGDEINYYPNGLIYTKTRHERREVKLIDCLDSLGNVLTANGRGQWIIFDNNFKAVIRSFTVKDYVEEAVFINFVKPKGPVAERTMWPGEDKYFTANSLTDNSGTYKELHQFIIDSVKIGSNEKAFVYSVIYVGLFVEKDGSLSDVQVFQSTYNTLSEKIIRALKSWGKWQPVYKNNQPIRAPFIIPINFLRDSLLADTSSKNIFINTGTTPSFKGGSAAFTQLLSKNIIYPKAEKEKGVTGEVITSFIVEKDGTINNIQIHSTPSIGLAEEAIRFLRSSPKWIPATIKGKPVRMRYDMPINFALGKD
ncbi:TonB family protein [Mucilaginibacter sp. HD30]